jgi:hypothetical protein
MTHNRMHTIKIVFLNFEIYEFYAFLWPHNSVVFNRLQTTSKKPFNQKHSISFNSCRFRDSTVGMATGYGLGSIPVRGEIFFSNLQPQDRLLGPHYHLPRDHSRIFPEGFSGRIARLTTQPLYAVRPRMEELYHQSQ